MSGGDNVLEFRFPKNSPIQEAMGFRKEVADYLRAQAEKIESGEFGKDSRLIVVTSDEDDAYSDINIYLFGFSSMLEILGLMEVAKSNILAND